MEIYSTKHDLKFKIRPETSDLKAIKEVIEKNDYERKFFKILPEETWLDLGGYIGSFGILAAQKGAKVVAFEPFKQSHDLYSENIKINGFEDKIKLVNSAVTLTTGRSSLGVSKSKNYWRNSLIKTPAKGSEEEVKTIALKEIIKLGDCMKMDIEGSEFELLSDLSLYKNIKKLVYEHSFDVNNSLDLYRGMVSKLKEEFGNINFKKVPDNEPVWKTSWFPPCAKVFCWRA